MLGDHSRLFLRNCVTWKYNITSGNDWKYNITSGNYWKNNITSGNYWKYNITSRNDFGDLLYTKLWELKRAGTHNDNLNFYFSLLQHDDDNGDDDNNNIIIIIIIIILGMSLLSMTF